MAEWLLCFDDLERANVDVIDILGYINNFVEHDHIKTIIICNEKELSTKLKSSNLEMKTFIATYLLDKENKLNVKTDEPMVQRIQDTIEYVFDKANELSGKLFGERLGDVLEKKILEPIKDMWKGFKKWFGNTITTMTRGVVGYIKDTSDNLAVKHIKAGKGGYISNSKFKKLQESGKLDGLTDEEIENYRSGRADYLSSQKDKRKADKVKLEEYKAKKAAKKSERDAWYADRLEKNKFIRIYIGKRDT